MTELRYSLHDVVAAMRVFVSRYPAGLNEDVALLLSDIERSTPSSLIPSDPAMWTDWLSALWTVRGYTTSQPRPGSEVVLTFPSGAQSPARVELGRNADLDIVPAGEQVPDGMTELAGMEVFRDRVRKACWEARLSTLAALETYLGEPTQEDSHEMIALARAFEISGPDHRS
jgi:hypothetical protein